MTVLTTTTKATVAGKAAKGVAKRPGAALASARAAVPGAKLSLAAAKPLAKRRARKRANRIGETARRVGTTARNVGEALVVYGPQAAQELGLVERPKPKRTAPRVAGGVVIGASAMYFLDPENGRAHREKVVRLVA